MNRAIAAAIFMLIFVLMPLAARLTAKPKTSILEQRVYVPRCSGGWYVSSQGTEGESDWIDVKCNDSDEQ